MERVDIWYLTDNEKGEKIADAIKSLGLTINLVRAHDLSECNIVHSSINLFIIDLANSDVEQVMNVCRDDPRLQPFIKFIVLNKKEIRRASGLASQLLHVEFISRPVQKREFLLLLEKSLIVERYREIMSVVSKEAENRIEAYENLLDINRRDIFESEKEKHAFEKIVDFEKHIMKEQKDLNRAITEFSVMRQQEMFDMKKRINAEEMLAGLRRQELMDAQRVINAQESVIEFSSQELDDAKRIIDANERAHELGRMEAMELHQELGREKQKNVVLQDEINRLKSIINEK